MLLFVCKSKSSRFNVIYEPMCCSLFKLGLQLSVVAYWAFCTIFHCSIKQTNKQTNVVYFIWFRILNVEFNIQHWIMYRLDTIDLLFRHHLTIHLIFTWWKETNETHLTFFPLFFHLLLDLSKYPFFLSKNASKHGNSRLSRVLATESVMNQVFSDPSHTSYLISTRKSK